jgi:hypothetical protein
MIIEVTPLIIFSSGFTLYLTFPPEIKLNPISECLPHTLLSSADCTTLPENRLKVIVGFITSPNPAVTKFAFKILNLKNPISTKPTSPFTEITAYDILGDQVAYLSETGPTLTNKEPAISVGTLD